MRVLPGEERLADYLVSCSGPMFFLTGLLMGLVVCGFIAFVVWLVDLAV